MKIVINADYGGFSVSNKAIQRYAELKGIALFPFKWDHSSNGAIPITWEEALQPRRRFVDIMSFSTEPIVDGVVKNGTILGPYDLKRDDPILVQVVEELGAEANGSCATLKVVRIPDGVDWELEEYDGSEWISEKHNTWR